MQNYSVRKKVTKLAPKKREPKDWCPSAGARLDDLTARSDDYYWDFRQKNSVAHSHDASFGVRHERFQHTFIRCPGCGRRLHPKLYDSLDGFEGFVVPPHKAK